MLSMNLREQSSRIYKFLHLLDCLVAVGLLVLLVYVYDVPWSRYYTILTGLTFVLCFISFYAHQMYRSWRGWQYWREFLVIIRAWGTVLAALLVYFFLFKISHAYSRFVFIVWSVAMPVVIFLLHLSVRRILRHLRTRGYNLRRAVVVGAGDLGRRLTRKVESIPWAGIEVLGYFDDKLKGEEFYLDPERPVFGAIADLPGFLEKNDIDYIYIALPMRAEKKIFSILQQCRTSGAQLFLVPDLYTFGLHHASVQSLGDMLVLNFNPDFLWKRTFDVVFSLLVIGMTLPLQLLIALAVKLEDGGPVVYHHTRVTSAGRPFRCMKFRSMRPGADQLLPHLLEKNPELAKEWRESFKLKNDPRVTRVGHFLRRTSLDELPQFYNVLKGEMSVVGSRPVVAEELKGYYGESAGRYCSMKPGITGPWQSGRRSDTTDYRERVMLDDWYVLNYSLANDLKIIWRTILAVVRGNGAY